MKGPILLTGAYRSGSTLLAQILNTHAQIVLPYDKAHFFRFYLDHAFPIEENFERIIREAEDRFKERFDINVPYDDIINTIKQKNKITFGMVYETFMMETFSVPSKGIRWGEKTLLQWSNIPLFLQMLENSQAIHIIRDPRDVLASKKKITWETPYRYLDAVFACLHSMNWAKTRRGVLLKKRYKIVLYEELIKNPEGQVREICDFLELPFDEKMLNSNNFKDGLGNPWQPNTAFEDIDQGISEKALQRWKSSLENWEVLFTESILGDLLEPFGYEPSGLDFNSDDLSMVWDRIKATPLIQGRLQHWFSTGEGIEGHSSDPRSRENWAKGKFV